MHNLCESILCLIWGSKQLLLIDLSTFGERLCHKKTATVKYCKKSPLQSHAFSNNNNDINNKNNNNKDL